MTLAELEQLVRSGNEVMLTLQQVSEVTGAPYPRVRRWVYRSKILPTVPVGPTLQPRIRGSLVVRLFCFDAPPQPASCAPLYPTS